MVRIRIGDSWKHNPAWRSALRALAEGRSKGFSPREIVDVLGIEVDGVDLARGTAEAPLFDAVAALVRAARSLAAADGRACVRLPGAPVELRLERSGADLHLSIASTADGALLVRDVVVDPRGLYEAARRAARLFVRDLVAIHPALGDLRLVRGLAREVERAPARARAPLLPSAPAPAPDDPDAFETAPPDAAAVPQPPRALPRRRGVRAPDLPRQGLRRLLLRRAWRVDGPGRRARLERCGTGFLASAGGRTELRGPDGALVWSAPLHDARVLSDGGELRVAGRDPRGALLALEPATGRPVLRVPAGLHGRLAQVFALPGALAACDEARLVYVRIGTAGPRWSFDPGPERVLKVDTFPGGFVAASDRGDVHALDAQGRPGWRAEARLDLLETVSVDVAHGLVVAGGLDVHGHVALVALELADGALRWQLSLDGVRPGEPAILRDRVVLSFDSSAGPALAAVDVRTGRVAWRTVPPDEGAVAPVVGADRVLVARAGGGLCAWSRAGRLLWRAPPRDPDRALSPVRPRPPVVGAGLAVVAAALVHVFDPATGRPLAALEPSELAPDPVLLLDGPVVVAASRESPLLEAWRLAGHLSLAR